MGVPEELRGLAEVVFGIRLPLANAYADLLSDTGVEWGLIGPREVDRIWERHILNSVCLEPLLPLGCWVADLGSGAGLPGMPLAIARPDLHIDLVEPMGRRTKFLQLCLSVLGLEDSVRVIQLRAQDYRGGVPVLTCRALASVKELIEMTAHLVPPGELLAIKGDKVDSELAAAHSGRLSRQLKTEVLRPTIAGATLGTVLRVWREPEH